MKKALKATYLLAPLFFGFIIGSAIAENGMAGLWVTLLILDIVVGIILQRIVDEEGTSPAKKPAASTQTQKSVREAYIIDQLLKQFDDTMEKEESAKSSEAQLKENFNRIFTDLLSNGVTRDVKSLNEDEAGRLLTAVCGRMQYAPSPMWLTGIFKIGVMLFDNTPAIYYAFDNERWEICQNALVFLVLTPENQFRLFTMEASFKSWVLCEFPGTGHINYGDVEFKDIIPRIKEILSHENLESDLPF